MNEKRNEKRDRYAYGGIGNLHADSELPDRAVALLATPKTLPDITWLAIIVPVPFSCPGIIHLTENDIF